MKNQSKQFSMIRVNIMKLIQQNVQVPKRQKPSEVSAVEVVHPGASYNPGYEEHQVISFMCDPFAHNLII